MPDEKRTGTNPLPPEQSEQTAPPVLTIRINRTTYKVAVHFSKTSKETMGDKIARLIESEAENETTFAPNPPNPPPEKTVPQNGLTAGKDKQ